MSRRYNLRFDAQRDTTEPELARLATRLGVRLWQISTLADFLALIRGRWEVVEIKNPDREGHAEELTPAQRAFHAEVFQRGGRVLVWRVEQDVLDSIGARVTAG